MALDVTSATFSNFAGWALPVKRGPTLLIIMWAERLLDCGTVWIACASSSMREQLEDIKSPNSLKRWRGSGLIGGSPTPYTLNSQQTCLWVLGSESLLWLVPFSLSLSCSSSSSWHRVLNLPWLSLSDFVSRLVLNLLSLFSLSLSKCSLKPGSGTERESYRILQFPVSINKSNGSQKLDWLFLTPSAAGS